MCRSTSWIVEHPLTRSKSTKDPITMTPPNRSLSRSLFDGAVGIIVTALVFGGSARAQPCADGAGSRPFVLSPKDQPRVGSFQHPGLQLERGEVILTFDDGPRPETTPQILDALAAACVKATFFMVGRMVDKSPDLVRRVAQEGHVIATHSWSHKKLDEMDREEAVRDVAKGVASVRTALGSRGDAAKPLFRFPFYAQTPELLAWLQQNGVAVVSADVSSEDWKGQAPDVTRERTMARLKRRGGGILVLHDTQPNTVALLPALLADLKREGFRIRTLTTPGRSLPLKG
jgi:peptidoglycan/xylan/chitin deacetylase (PgdA/CDA1 family)